MKVLFGTVSSYLGNRGKRVNFGNGIAEIQQSMREKEKKRERENFEFRQWHHRNSCCPNLLTEKPIVVMPLPK